jgi:acid phosphatase
VFLIVLENHAFNQVIGSPFMPYLNSLAAQHSLATNYFADTHPSIGNYFMLTTGNIETNNDAFTGTVSSDNFRAPLHPQARLGKRTWKAYLLLVTGGDVYPYFKHHNPFAYMTDVLGLSAETANMVPFTQLSSDLAAGAVPNFAFIGPMCQYRFAGPFSPRLANSGRL